LSLDKLSFSYIALIDATRLEGRLMTRAKYVEIGVQRGLSAALRDSRGVDPQVFQFPRAPNPRQNNFKTTKGLSLIDLYGASAQ